MTILIILTIYGIIASTIFYVVAFTNRRIFRKRYDLPEAAKRFTLALIRMNKAMASMGVSAAEASAALKKFNMVYSQQNSRAFKGGSL